MNISFLYPAFLWLLLVVPLFIALGWPEKSSPERWQRWLGLALRLLVLLGLVLGLAGAQLERSVETVTTVFVLDVSDSIPVEAQSRAEAFLRQALAGKPDDDRAAVILFGGEPLVEQLPTQSGSMPGLSSIPLKSATDIESALRLALALLPNEGGSRIVLLSDGQETAGQARRMAELAAARQVELTVYPLAATAGSNQPGEVLVEQVTAPGQARQGQSVPVEVTLIASQPADTMLRLFADGTLVESRAVRLNGGRNRFSFNVPVEASGFRRFRVEVEAANDTRPQNNRGAAFTTVYGPPRVLLVEGRSGEVDALVAALDAAGMQTDVIAPGEMPQRIADLAVYDSVVLANVPAETLPVDTQDMLAGFVRDLGRGLVMLGGPESYGAGGYLRSPLERALPVDMEIRNQSREPNVALVLAVDKSGSMGACHCDDPDLRQQYSRIPSGLPKIDIAKEAVFQATQVLGDLDYLGVVAFDNAARWALETAPHSDLNAIEQAIGGLTANGQTNIFAGLTAAEESLAGVPARVKHIILLTDGWSSAGAYDHLLDRFSEAGITLSVVAAGSGSADYLAGLAEEGGGKYYPATNMLEVPKIFLKETVRAAGNFVIEEPFLPAPAVAGGSAASPILRGIDLDSAPALLGYNGSTVKDTAQVALLTPRGDPLLATWQYGLGRSVAWTSDLSGRWAQEWLAWEEFPRLAGQLVNWSLPVPDDDRLDVAVTTAGGEVALAATVLDERGQGRSFLDVSARLLAGDGTATEIELRPSGPGRYEATTTLPDEGVYLAQITAYDPAASEAGDGSTAAEPVAGRTTGLVSPYSPEYASLASDQTLLSDLATLTGGRLLDDPAQTFVPTAATGRQSRPLWPELLLLAALLFPLDVAVRRVRLGRREWQQARQWVTARVTGGLKPVTEETAPPLHSELFEARQRARERYTSPPPADQPPVSPPKSITTEPAQPTSPEPSSPEEQDTLARLRAAKRRAKR